jgi:hypothetical protein
MALRYGRPPFWLSACAELGIFSYLSDGTF